MPSNIVYDDEFRAWLNGQSWSARRKIAAKIGLLGEFGPGLGRPHVDTVYGSDFHNMKELRVQADRRPYRILFAFDPERNAAIMLGGDKASDGRWYEVNIPIADARYRRHLAWLEEQKKE